MAIFDELVALFRRRAPIPASGQHSRRYPDLHGYDFPGFLDLGTDAAFAERASAIRRDIIEKRKEFVEAAAPWTEAAILQPHSVDWVFSQSVLEHIDNLDTAYRALAQWLAPGGYMSHLIDFSSHSLTREWNGHWALGEVTWRALRGRRPYLINREPYAAYLGRGTANGFVTVLERRNKRFDGLIPQQFASPFREISEEDARTAMAFLVSRKAG